MIAPTLYYGAYVGMIAVMSLVDHLLAQWFHVLMGESFFYLNKGDMQLT
jgi:hypothetical protein